MADTIVKVCSENCKSDFQDRVYGAGKRLMNRFRDRAGGRCTVCGKDNVGDGGKGKKK